MYWNDMKTKAELDNKLQELKNMFGENALSNGSIADLRKWFKNYFNKDIVKVGDKLTFDFSGLFKMVPETKKKFNDDPIQPITVTYLRADIIFYTYDKHPELGEVYIMWDADWTKYLYPNEIKQSELWKNKEYLFHENPDEYYLQVNLFDIDSKYVNYIKNIDFSGYYNDNEPF